MTLAARKPETGLERPYRPCPRDFRETYVRLGWETIAEHYRTNWRCVRRWIDETGRDALKAERAEYVRTHGLWRLRYGCRELPASRSKLTAV